MIKKYSLSILFICLIQLGFAQIPNNGFENWTSMGTYSNPDGWGTFNNTSAIGSVFTAEKGTPGFVGSAYLKLTSKNTSLGVLNGVAVSGKLDTLTGKPKSGFAYASRPQNFTGKWQHMIYGTSQGLVAAVLTKWNTSSLSRDTVAIAYQVLSGMVMSWGDFSLNFNYYSGNNPDSCIIYLCASGATPANADYLWVDNLAFSGSVIGIDEKGSSSAGLLAYPIPAGEILYLDFQSLNSSPEQMELFDLNGKMLKHFSAQELKNHQMLEFPVQDFPSGMYLLQYQDKLGKHCKKISVQH